MSDVPMFGRFTHDLYFQDIRYLDHAIDAIRALSDEIEDMPTCSHNPDCQLTLLTECELSEEHKITIQHIAGIVRYDFDMPIDDPHFLDAMPTEEEERRFYKNVCG